MKKLLFGLAAILLVVAIVNIYQWYIAEPNNREALPALLSALSTLITLVIAWQFDNTDLISGGTRRSLLRTNKATIKGNESIVKQGTNGHAAVEKNTLDIDGSKHTIEQG